MSLKSQNSSPNHHYYYFVQQEWASILPGLYHFKTTLQIRCNFLPQSKILTSIVAFRPKKYLGAQNV